ncbi:unnamed protein product [Ectocarpus sp. 12 AP-2014]
MHNTTSINAGLLQLTSTHNKTRILAAAATVESPSLLPLPTPPSPPLSGVTSFAPQFA